MKPYFRDVLGRAWRIAMLCFFSFCLAACAVQERENETAEEARVEFFAMDTKIAFSASGKEAQSALAAAQEMAMDYDERWSAEREASEIYRLNHAQGALVALSADTMEILEESVRIGAETEGAFDITLDPVRRLWGFVSGGERPRSAPQEAEIQAMLAKTGYEKLRLETGGAALARAASVELGGIAKGYAGEKIAERLRARGICSALLDLGGNIQAVGRKADGTLWRIGLRNPFGGEMIGVLSVEDTAVITSAIDQRFFQTADGRRYWHILNPKTGRPAESGLASVAIVAADGSRGDALSTAIFVMGRERATDFWRKKRDFDMILVDFSGKIWLTEKIAENFTKNEAYQGEWEVIR